MKVYAPSQDVQALEQRLAAIRQEKDAALASEEFERCASLRDEGKKIADEIAALKQEKKRHDDAKLIVTEEGRGRRRFCSGPASPYSS